MDKRILIAVGAVAIILIIVLVFALSSGGSKQTTPVASSIKIWGVWPNSYLSGIINDFANTYQGITVNYTQIDEANYQDKLLGALAAGNGPDIFMVKNTWVYKYGNILSPAPQGLFSQNDISNFFNVNLKDFYLNKKLWAEPVVNDVLLLFYNTDIFNAAGILTPPKTWNDLTNDVVAVNSFSQQNNANFTGVALGGANNITYAPDIIYSLALQSGQGIYDLNRGYDFIDLKNIFNFYLGFAQPQNTFYSWNEANGSDLSLFSQGKVAMIFAYLRDKAKIQTLNPRLNFAISSLPQQNPTQPINFANYWAFGVWRLSPSSATAWAFLKFLISAQAQVNLAKTVNEPPSQKTNAAYVSGDIKTVALQALTATDVFTPDADKSDLLLRQSLADVIFNKKSLDTSLQQLQSTLNTLIKPSTQ